MRVLRILPLILLPFLLAAKGDLYQPVAPADRQLLKEGLDRYVQDQIKRNWSDLFEIKIPGYAIETNYDDLSGNAPVLSKHEFIEKMYQLTSNGTEPYMQSFDLVSITPVKGGYEVHGCSKAQRESFHFKGILTFTAYVSDGQVHFGGWKYIYLMPHLCSQTEDSKIY